MSNESQEFIRKVTDESTTEYAEKAVEKEATRRAAVLTDYLESLDNPVRVADALAWISSYAAVYAPEVMKSAIAIHKSEHS